MTPFPRPSYNAVSGPPAESHTKGNPLIRLVTRRLCSVTIALLALYGGVASAAQSAYRASSQDARGATLEIIPSSARFDSTRVEGVPYVRVSILGAQVTEPSGRPALPTMMIPVGVPDGMTAKLRIVSAEWEERGGLPPPIPVAKQRFVGDDPKTGPVTEVRFEPDPAIYGRGNVWPGEIITMGEGGPLGDAWMMPALLRVVRYDPGHKRFLVLKRMTLRVDFAAASAAELKLRPAVRPGADVGAWDRVRRGLLANYESARGFPRRATPGAMRAPRLSTRRASANPEFRVSVTSTGWTSVSFAALSAAGFPGGVSISQVGVWERGYDDAGDSAISTPIPVVARDANGIFDGGDAITFYARNLRDRVGPLSIENRYAYANVYWVSWTAGAAAVPDTISSVISDPAPAMPTSFQDTIHLEQNIGMWPAPNSTVGSPQENVEYMFWTNGTDPDLFNTTIPFVHPDVSAPFRVQARYQGQTSTATHRINAFFQSSTGVTDTLAFNHDFFGQDIYLLDTGFTVPGSLIGSGSNQYQHQGFARYTGPFVQGSGSDLDWIDVTYSRLYVADSNRLEFTSGAATGVAELHVGGFTQPGVEVYDVTVPTATLRVTGATVNNLGAGNYEVSFRTDATSGVRRFVALVPGAELSIAAGAVQADTPSNLGIPSPFPGGSLARSILVAPEAFLAPANRLATYRRGQGYVVEVASIQDIYDEFSGGIKSATAIRRYFQHAYDTWTPRPSFAVLLGDASLDYRKDLVNSAVDWIPTYFAFEVIAGPHGADLAGQDARYVLNLGRGTSSAAQNTPSIFLGRVPASSATELDQFVTKLIRYENFQPTDDWRGRQLLFSDDEYSSTIFFDVGYCRQPSETMFKAASQYMQNVTAASAPGSDVHSELFDLKGMTDALASCCPGPTPDCRNLGLMVIACRTTNGPNDSLMGQLARGFLIFNAETHANRKLMTHEQVFDVDYGDMARIANVDRPFFYMIWGCHANQFPDAAGGINDIDSTDSFGEQWVMMPDRGAIGGLGSTGYEILDTNAAMNGYMAEAFYRTPPAPGGTARWIMGEIVAQAYVRNAASGFPPQREMNRTMMILGEPMTRMDALPPRVFEVTVDGNPFPEGAPIVAATASDSIAIVAKTRDEAGLTRTDLLERAVGSGAITPVDSTLYSVAVSDSGRAHTLTGRYRPHIGNYDLLVRSIDTNGREQTYVLQVRSTARYLANGVVLVNGAFVESSAILRAEVTTPIPVTADSLTLLLDGIPLANVTKTAMDGTNRRWALVTAALDLTRGPHTLDVEVSGRGGVFPQATFNVETALSLRRVAVVSPRLMGSGCDGSVFQFELSTATPTVRLLLMTVSGRRVASLEWSGNAGFNTYCWDGRDSQGNLAGNGVYFYRLTAIDASGHKATQDGRMIRSR